MASFFSASANTAEPSRSEMLDESGERLWERHLENVTLLTGPTAPATGWMRRKRVADALQATQDGGFALAAQGDGHGRVIRLDADGNELWVAQYDAGPEPNPAAVST